MRFILKIFAAPIVVVLTILVAVLSFLLSMATWILNILALFFFICGIFAWAIAHEAKEGISMIITAFVLSPFGLPAVAGWLVDKLDTLNYNLKEFMWS